MAPYEKAKQFCELFSEDIPTPQRGHDNDYADTDGKCEGNCTHPDHKRIKVLGYVYIPNSNTFYVSKLDVT